MHIDPSTFAGDYRYDRRLPPGEYHATIHEAMDRDSKKGNPMLALVLHVDGPEGGVVIEYYLPVGHFPERWESFLAAVDPEAAAAWRDRQPFDLDPMRLLDRPLRVRTINEEWEGKARPRVDAVLPGLSADIRSADVPF